MVGIRGITVAVGRWYASTLAVTLVRNMRHLTECLVVSAPGDEAVKAVVAKVPGASVFETNSFYENGAIFNKGLSMERGFDVMGREGWIAVVDADILLPDSLPLDGLRPDTLYGARRRVLEDVSKWGPDLDWKTCPLLRDGGPIGFTQIFNCDSIYLKDKRPWYNVNYPHAGGCDAAFIGHWPASRRVLLPVEVMHLGPVDTNWWGTDAKGREMAAAYFHRMGWRRAMAKHDPTAVNRVGELIDRVDVPGYETSDFRMPFEKRRG